MTRALRETAGCPRHYEIDAFWLAGRPAHHPFARHLEGCPACRAALEECAAAEAEFAADVFPRTIDGVVAALGSPRKEGRAPLGRRLIRLAPLAAAAVVALGLGAALLVSRRPSTRDDGAYLGAKGSVGLEVYCRRGDRVLRLGGGDTMLPDDALRFVPRFDPGRARYAMVVSVDAAGAVSPYFPLDGDAARRVDAPGRPLPGSVVLDDSAGAERLFLLVSERPFALPEVRAAAAAGLAAAGDLAHLDALPLDLDQASLLLDKRGAPR
jgi:hypothetical protein